MNHKIGSTKVVHGFSIDIELLELIREVSKKEQRPMSFIVNRLIRQKYSKLLAKRNDQQSGGMHELS